MVWSFLVSFHCSPVPFYLAGGGVTLPAWTTATRTAPGVGGPTSVTAFMGEKVLVYSFRLRPEFLCKDYVKV